MSSFIDNPVVASLANLTGLTHLLGTDTNAATSAGAPHSAIQRPEYQQAHPMLPPRNMSYGSPTAQGTPVVSPGALSPETLQSPTVSALLAHFGVSSNVPLDDHLFIHDPAAFARHPLIAGAIDGALSGLANTRGSDTVGEGLSNVAQGLAATHAQQIQQVNNQLMAPLMQANAVAQLQDQIGKQSLQEAQQRHDNAMSDYYTSLLPARMQMNQANNDTKTDIANTNANTRTSMSPVAQQNLRILNRINTVPGNNYSAQSEVPPDVWNKAALEQQAAESTAKAAGAIKTKQTIPGKAPGSGKQTWKSPADQDEYRQIDNQVNDLGRQVQQLNSGKGMDENGTPIIDPAEIQKRKQALFTQAAQLRNRQGALAAANGIVATPQSAAPAPAPTAGGQQLYGTYDPTTNIINRH